jgi:Transposase DDE domain
VPDHATIARFISRHQVALGELFGSVLGLCAKAGLVSAGVVAVDGSKISGNASPNVNVDYGQIAREIVEQTIATDQAEDEQHGDMRGDELPAELGTEEGRRAWLARELAVQRDAEQHDRGDETEAEPEDEFDAAEIVARTQGREGWLRAAKRQLDRDRWQTAGPVPRSRSERLWGAARRLEDDLAAEVRGNAAYQHYRATGRMKNGRRFGAPPKPYQPPDSPPGVVNLTDPDSRLMKGQRAFVQGYNAQAAVNEQQIVLAAEICTEPVDFSSLAPLLTATRRELDRAGITDPPGVVIADAGFWNEQHIDQLAADGIAVLIPPDSRRRKGERPGWTGGRYSWMRHLLSTDQGAAIYRRRSQSIEPLFGHTKHNRQFTYFHRRGRAAVRTEWRLLMATHNLTKLHKHQIATTGA